jgi:hypothetical protein
MQVESFDSGGLDDWKRGFDRPSSKGLTCLRCGALVPEMPDLTQRHRDWHAELDRRLDGR